MFTRLCATILVLVLALAESPALADPPGSGRSTKDPTLSTLGSERVAMEAALASRVTFASVAESTPILLRGGFDASSPKHWRIALAASGLSIRTIGDQISIAPRDLAEERRVSATRRLDAAPIQLDESTPGAIGSGAVFLYGRPLSPPYQFETDSEGVSLNGVRIIPAPGPRADLPTPGNEQRSWNDRLLDATSRWSERGVTETDRENARNRLLADLRAAPEISQATWINEDEIEFLRADGSKETLVVGGMRDPNPPTPAQKLERYESDAAALEELLRQDHVLVVGANYIHPLSDVRAGSFRETVEEVRSAGIDDATRILRIQSLVFDRFAATDIVFAD